MIFIYCVELIFMDSPLISVITIVYNSVSTIEETILSVINQTYPYVEYIIIDGNSKDGTLDVVKKYYDKISYLISEPDRGIYDAMNKGLKLATGNWVNFMNSGDCFYSETVLSDIFANRDLTNQGVIYGDTLMKYDLKHKVVLATPFFNSKSFYHGMGICHKSLFVRMDCVRNLEFNLQYKISADYHMMFNFYRKGIRFCYIPMIVSVYDAVRGLSKEDGLCAIYEDAKVLGIEKDIRFRFFIFCLKIRHFLGKYIKNVMHFCF